MTHLIKFIDFEGNINYLSEQGFSKNILKAVKFEKEAAFKKLNFLKKEGYFVGYLFAVNVIEELTNLYSTRDIEIEKIKKNYKSIGI